MKRFKKCIQNCTYLLNENFKNKVFKVFKKPFFFFHLKHERNILYLTYAKLYIVIVIFICYILIINIINIIFISSHLSLPSLRYLVFDLY